MLKRSFAIVCVASVSFGATHAATVVKITPDDLNSYLESAHSYQAKLFKAKPLTIDLSGEYILVTSFGGIGQTADVVGLARNPQNTWVVEEIWRQSIFQTENEPQVFKRSFALTQRRAREIDTFLDDKSLFTEPLGLTGGCTDQPIVTIEIVHNGQKRNSARIACPPDDKTESLIKAVHAALPPH